MPLSRALLPPRDSLETFVAFLRWATRRGVEGDDLETLWHASSVLMARTRGADLTKHGVAAAAYAELRGGPTEMGA